MELLITLSLALNLAVLVPVCASLLGHAGWTQAAYGPPAPARGILLSIYAAILLLSGGLLLQPVTGSVAAMVVALLLVQIVYKVTTPFTVGSFANPVVLSNLAIAAFHAVTVRAILPQIGF